MGGGRGDKTSCVCMALGYIGGVLNVRVRGSLERPVRLGTWGVGIGVDERLFLPVVAPPRVPPKLSIT